MAKRHILIADGPNQPEEGQLDAFWSEAVAAHPDLEREHQVRSIGIDAETTELILDFVAAGTKVATFSLPWVMQANGFPDSTPGTPIILSDYQGAPRVVVRLTDVRETTFGEIGSAETRLDGPPVQDPDIWLPLHREFWNGLLKSYGKSCTDDMPVLIEPFEFVFAPG
ncbi:MAG: ASCH domain-containing protein [Congregibacter sp.]